MFRPPIVTMYITVRPADTTTLNYKDGDTIYTAHGHPSLRQLAQIILSIFYILTYIINLIFIT